MSLLLLRLKPVPWLLQRSCQRASLLRRSSSSTPALVSREWLIDALEEGKEEMLVLEVAREAQAKEEFNSKHIATAQFFNLLESSAPPSPTLVFPPPDPERFQAQSCRLGINQSSHLVIYDKAPIPNLFASRLWWTFRVHGHTQVSVLNGGFKPYEQHPKAKIASGEAQPRKEGNFTVNLNENLIRDYEDMKSIVSSGSSQILDTRLSINFNGEELEPSSILLRHTEGMPLTFHKDMKRGHYPGARNIPFTELIDPETGYYTPKDQILKIIQGLGVDLDKPITATCYLGYSACMLAVALHTCGKHDVPVYYGSWTEWSQREID